MLWITAMVLTASRNDARAGYRQMTCRRSPTMREHGLAPTRRFAIALTAMVLCGSPARSAELFYMDHDAFTGRYTGPVGPLVLSGDIAPGDYDRLLSKISEDPDRFLTHNKVIVASTAGDAGEAVRIATLLKSLYSEVDVGPLTGRCAGACFLIFAAAAQRSVDGERLLGIDVPVQDTARAFLAENGVPADLLGDGALRAPQDQPTPQEVHWLTQQDLARLGGKSPAFDHFLAGKCAWDDELERAANAGRRSFDDLKPIWACRIGATRAEARKALAAAIKGSAPRR
jgi:hypothetical protein